MLAVLAEFLGLTLKYITEKSLNSSKNKLERRRGLLAKLLVLYNSVQDLRQTAEDVYREFSNYASGDDTATKVVSAQQMQNLLSAFKDFQKSSADVTDFLEIYSPQISGFIARANSIKMGFFWKVIDVTEHMIPSMKEVDGRKTFTLVFPTSLPSLDRVDKIDPSISSHDDLEAKSAVFRDFLLNPYNFVEVQINDTSLLDALVDVPESLKSMSDLEVELREFIKANFPIDRIFEAAH